MVLLVTSGSAEASGQPAKAQEPVVLLVIPGSAEASGEPSWEPMVLVAQEQLDSHRRFAIQEEVLSVL